ncbi:hypothetical protein GGR51DRAFT_374743 [Nemania sp. FL0031]|nr:hypothetical protein GGR51DRAFT_374743 [Nemania sp. FL0031]
MKRRHEDGDEDEDEEQQMLDRDNNRTPRSHGICLAVRTTQLNKLAEALDRLTNEMGSPIFLPSKAQLKLFSEAREGGRWHAEEEPNTRQSYIRLHKAALKGLRANAIAYKLALDKENVVLQDVPKHARVLFGMEEEEDEDEDMLEYSTTQGSRGSTRNSNKRPRTEEQSEPSSRSKRARRIITTSDGDSGDSRDPSDGQALSQSVETTRAFSQANGGGIRLASQNPVLGDLDSLGNLDDFDMPFEDLGNEQDTPLPLDSSRARITAY